MIKFITEILGYSKGKSLLFICISLASLLYLVSKLLMFYGFIFLGNEVLLGNIDAFLPIAVAIIAIGLIIPLWGCLSDNIKSRFISRCSANLQLKLMNAINHKKLNFWNKYSSGDVINHVENDSVNFISLLHYFMSTIIMLPGSLALIVIALILDWRITLLAFTVSVLAKLLLSEYLNKFISNTTLSVQEAADKNLHTLVQIIKSTTGNRWFANSGPKRIAYLQEATQEVYVNSVKRDELFNRRDVINAGFHSVSTLILFATAAYFIFRGEVTIGVFLAINSVRDDFLFAITLWTQLRSKYSEAKIYKERIDNLLIVDTMETANAFESTIIDTNTVVQFNNVCYHYENEETMVLNNFNMKLEKGSILDLRGPSGSGKSTIIKLLMGFHQPTSGEIKIFGHGVNDKSADFLRNSISYIPQQSYFFDDTIINNIRLSKLSATDEEVIQSAKDAQIHDFILSLPMGYDTHLKNNAVNLSAGQKQRLAIARAILRDGPLVLIDEMTSHVDIESERLILSALKEFLKGKTAITIAHNTSFDVGATKECYLC